MWPTSQQARGTCTNSNNQTGLQIAGSQPTSMYLLKNEIGKPFIRPSAAHAQRPAFKTAGAVHLMQFPDRSHLAHADIEQLQVRYENTVPLVYMNTPCFGAQAVGKKQTRLTEGYAGFSSYEPFDASHTVSGEHTLSLVGVLSVLLYSIE